MSEGANASDGKRYSARRSALEIQMDVLRVVEAGAEKPTDIMNRANLAWVALQNSLGSLVGSGLLRRLGGTQRRYELTQRGKDVLESFRRILAEVQEPPGGTGSSQFRLTEEEPELEQLKERIAVLEETTEILADSELLKGVRSALNDVKAGRYKHYDSVSEYAKTLT